MQQLSFPAHLRIVGDGPKREELAAAIGAAGLSERVELCRSVTHSELPSLYAAAHIVVVPSVVDQSGDRDGLPNVVLEAMACGRAVVGSDVGAVSSAVISEKTGLLVPPGEPDRLAHALTRLALAPTLRATLAANARAHVVEHFDLRSCTTRFCRLLEYTYGLEEVPA
jgi:glycosyltransferase involved in cell wall biosynthesis